MGFQAVLFDGYGTLFRDAMETLEETCKEMLAEVGVEMSPGAFLRAWDAQFFPLIRGDVPFVTLREAQTLSLEAVFRDLKVNAASQPYVDRIFDRFGRSDAYPDVAPSLSGLAGRLTGVVSNADEDHLSQALEMNRLRFPVVVSSEAARCYKPEPEIFRQALEALGCRPEAALYVGDSQEDDIVGAGRAGLKVAWLNRPGASRKPGVPVPDFEIRSLEEVPAIVGSTG